MSPRRMRWRSAGILLLTALVGSAHAADTKWGYPIALNPDTPRPCTGQYTDVHPNPYGEAILIETLHIFFGGRAHCLGVQDPGSRRNHHADLRWGVALVSGHGSIP